MKITYKEDSYKCDIWYACGDGHYCNECADALRKAEPIDLTKAVIGEKFLTRSGKEATLINILNDRKRGFVFADSLQVWSTSRNGFVNTILSSNDIIKKIE